LVQQNFHADGCNQISSLSLSVLRLYGNVGSISPERVALAIYCLEFLKGEEKVSDVSGFCPAFTVFLVGGGMNEREGMQDGFIYVYDQSLNRKH
jgi:hypothetical protein